MSSLIRKKNTETDAEGWGKVHEDELDAGIKDAHYTHEQLIATTTWEVNHGFGKRPTINAYDSYGELMLVTPNHIEVDGVCNQSVLNFEKLTTGVAICN